MTIYGVYRDRRYRNRDTVKHFYGAHLREDRAKADCDELSAMMDIDGYYVEPFEATLGEALNLLTREDSLQLQETCSRS